MQPTTREIISQLSLQPHPEGGYYRETYRSKELIPQENLPGRFTGERCFATAIYYLLNDNDFSGFHRIKSEESWHHYMGEAIEILIIDDEGNLYVRVLGKNLSAGQQPQLTIDAGSWFSAHVENKQGYALAGCTVAPGFDFEDFEMGVMDSMILQFPQHREILSKYCRK